MDLISSNIALDWKSVTTTFVKEFESIDACSIKSVDKGQLYELYNHFLTTLFVSLQQDKDNSSACRNVPSK